MQDFHFKFSGPFICASIHELLASGNQPIHGFMGQSKKFLREKEIRKANEYIHGFMNIYAKGKLVDGWIKRRKSQSMNQCICKAVEGAVLGELIDRCMNLRVNDWADMGLLWG